MVSTSNVDKIIKWTSPLLTCLHSIQLVFHSQSIFTRSQVPVQFFKEPPINPSKIQHQSERCNDLSSTQEAKERKTLRQNQGNLKTN